MREKPGFLVVNHADQGADDFVVGFEEMAGGLIGKIAAFHREFDPNLGFGGFEEAV
tara:strand:- start:2684 stop:2851 length:168 start_codon:yes stop_codon:yes gene_type:complete